MVRNMLPVNVLVFLVTLAIIAMETYIDRVLYKENTKCL